MSKFRFTLDLQLFSEEMGAVDTGVDTASAAEVQPNASEPGVETQAAADPEKQNNFEKAFAKRLAEKESEWKGQLEAERAKYKDYDQYKEVAEYFREVNQAQDIMSLRERIEMERLQHQAEEQNLPVEVLKRLNELEAKAAEGEKIKAQQEEETRLRSEQEQQQQVFKEFRTGLETFAKDKGVDADSLHQFMYDNQIGNMDAAFKAFKYDELQQQVEKAEKEGVKKFLSAKGSIPTVTGNTAQGHVASPAPKTMADARVRAMQRLSD